MDCHRSNYPIQSPIDFLCRKSLENKSENIHKKRLIIEPIEEILNVIFVVLMGILRKLVERNKILILQTVLDKI